MANDLATGTHRVGDFIDFYPETPKVMVTLERTAGGISITIPWTDERSAHAQWFLADSGRLQLPLPSPPPPAPRRVLFQDPNGSVLLIRCWPRGFHANMLGPGTGTLWARAAIMGVSENIEFERPQGIQTDISGLRAWLGITSWDESHAWEVRPLVASLTSKHVPAIEVCEYRQVALTFQPGWQVVPEEGRDRRVLLDRVRCVTRSEQPLEWDGHRHLHRAVRDLLVLSRWHAETCVEVLAFREDDPLRTLDGAEHGEQWRPVVVPDDERAAEPSGYRPHLIPYAELRTEGIRRWLTLRDEFSRALDPVVTSLDLRGTTPNTLLAHTGPGLEALGYLLLVRDGIARQTAARTSLRSRLERILRDVAESLPFNGAEWVTRTVAAYNGLKHANRAEPDPVDVVNTWRESVLVVRAWVAVELGIATDDIGKRLRDDPQNSPYVKVS